MTLVELLKLVTLQHSVEIALHKQMAVIKKCARTEVRILTFRVISIQIQEN